MIELVYSPQWFYGKDIIIDIVSIFALSLIAIFSIRYYRMERDNRNYLFLACSFMLMAISFLFKIITNFTIYYMELETRHLGSVTITYPVLESSNLLFSIGFLIHRLLMLFGLFILYMIYLKPDRSTMLLVSYMILISTYFSSSSYFIFHLTALILLIIITAHYWRNYRRVRHSTNRWLFHSFSLITFSQVVFVFVKINSVLYVIAEIVQLMGYFGLLVTFMKVLRDGKKERKK